MKVARWDAAGGGGGESTGFVEEIHVSTVEILTLWPETGKAFFSPSSVKRLAKSILTRGTPVALATVSLK